MSGFTPGEVEYMREGRLGRLATANASGTLQVVPVGFRYNPELGVVDDVLPPWRARGVEVRGRAEALEGDAGSGTGGELIRIFPERVVGWGIDADAPGPNVRSVPG